MATPRNNRKADREALDYPQIAVIFYETKKEKIIQFVNVMNLSIHGVLIESNKNLKKDFELNLMIHNVELDQWDTFFSRVAWVQVAEIELSFHIGLEFLFPVEQSVNQANQKKIESNQILHNQTMPQNLDFLLNTRLLSALPRKEICHFLNCMNKKTINRGVRFITQGEKADSLYLIQDGYCSIEQQTKNHLETLEYRRKGDVIGEMALLGCELCSTSAVSQSKMVLWQLSADKYDTACKSYPGMKGFLTEILTSCIENSTITKVREIGPYKISHRIARGDSGFTYKGHYKSLNIPVAIKMIRHDQAMDPGFSDNLKNKGGRLARLNHPNIARIYDIEVFYRTVFIIMEHLEGESLQSLLKRKPCLPFSRVLPFLLQICAGIAYAHDHKVIHQDIKPANIFITKNDRVKLLGSGLACSSDKKHYCQMDTVHYMSPEQVAGGRVDLRSDIYSFGILVYEMFTGQKPFKGNDRQAVMKMHLSTPIPDPAVLVPNLPDMIKAMIKKACAKSPDQRYNSMDEISEELIRVAQSLKMQIPVHHQPETKVTVLLVSHTENQTCSLNRLLDDFCRRAKEKGLIVNIAGKTTW